MKRYNLINNALGWLCFVIAAVTYLLTLEPTASFWDCPEFIAQGAKLEVGHPPGNPIFMLAARFFVTLFGNDVSRAAIAVNSMSALLSAGTILLLFWTITHLVRRLLVRDGSVPGAWATVVIMGSGLCGALAYTWSDTFWFSAVEAEVYAFSSFCTALVFWLILKWENRADEPHSDRYLILIAYIIGVSIAVHLLNLLCIPAIGLVIYFRKSRGVTAKGSLAALAVSCVVVGAILYGLVPGFVEVAQWFELLFVNGLGMSFNMGVLIYAVLLTAVFVVAIRAIYNERSATQIKLWSFVAVVLSGMPFIGSSVVVPVLIIGAMGVYLLFFCKKVPVRLFMITIASIFVIFIGYSSYMLLLLRAGANTPMNQNAPDNVFALSSYLNREQYGERPLFIGPSFAEELDIQEYPKGSGTYYVAVDEDGYPATRISDGYLRDENGGAFSTPTYKYTKTVKNSPEEPDSYTKIEGMPQYKTLPDLNMLLPRIYSFRPADVAGYKSWGLYEITDFRNIPENLRMKWAQDGFVPLYDLAPYLTSQQNLTVSETSDGTAYNVVAAWKPDFATNLRYFINYQLNHMYWRYFMWNFAGRQNDIQGNGEPNRGNWISGIPLIDNARLGDQSLLPDEFGKGNKGHNVFFMLPLLLGLIGLLWQALYRHRANEHRGIEQFWVVFFLFFMTGIAIVLYLNQTPGQPRERDYAFAGSFYAYAIWIGLGVSAIATMLADLLHRGKAQGDKEQGVKAWAAAGVAVAIGLFVPLQMVSQTWDDHDRSGRYTARDYGMNYLSSLDPDAIILTYGDNDTFPLWYAQEVEGYRTDVRVVNSSYLTTDWYANQQRHPYYDAKAVDMYATPQDYAYDRLSYSYLMPSNIEPTSAKEALEQMYASDAKTFGVPVMLNPVIYMPLDTVAARARYNMDTRPDSALVNPAFTRIELELDRMDQGLFLNRTLLLDMLSNSMERNWERPFYVASTVPTDQYKGLGDYAAPTGMAYEITPFKNPTVSPTVEKAYENVLGKFRWGGLDAEDASGLYLDETVRRMVASTRSVLQSVVTDLITTADLPASEFARRYAEEHGESVPQTRADMARRLLHLMEEKLPAKLAPYDNTMGLDIVGQYITLYGKTGCVDDLDRADAILDTLIPRYAQLVRYGQALTTSEMGQLDPADIYAMKYLGVAISQRNRIAMIRALAADKADPEAVVTARELADYPGTVVDANVSQLIYIFDTKPEDLEAERDAFTGSYVPVYDQSMLLLRGHDLTTTPSMQLTDKLVNEYGIDRRVWLSLSRLYY